MTYTNQNILENYLQRALTTNEAAFLPIGVAAAKDYIDRYTGTTFLQVSATSRTYDGGQGDVDIDPCTSITAVATIDNYGVVQYTYATNEYIAEPQNDTVKTYLRLRSNNSFPAGVANIQVTAKFSSYVDGVPEDIQAAATRIVAGLINLGKQDNDGANIASESLEGHSITYDTSASSVENIAKIDPIIQGILDQHRKLLLG